MDVISPHRRQPRSEEKRPLLAGNSSDDEGDEDEHQAKVSVHLSIFNDLNALTN